MGILDAPARLLEALSGEMTPKFLATRSPDGMPNVVPCTSIMPAGDEPDRLIFGNFLLRKTVTNLDADPRVGLLVITTDLEGWVLQGDFLGWQRAGPYVDRVMSTDLLRYNAYTGIRNAGIIQVRALLGQFRLSKLRVLTDYLVAAAAARTTPRPGTGATLPRAAMEPFGRLTAVRTLAFFDPTGHPLAVPAMSLQPVGDRALVCAQSLAADEIGNLQPGAPVAASLLTLDIISFQVKGHWLGGRRLLAAPVGAMAVAAVYAGGPPIPGGQVA